MILTILVTVCTISICIGVVKLGIMYLNSYRKLLRSKCFRGPRALPLLGNVHLFMGTTADIYQTALKLTTRYESPFRLWLGPRVCFMLHDAEQIKRILLNPNALEKGDFYDMLKPIFSQGLVTAEVSKWKPHRKTLEPLFSRRVLETFVDKIRRQALLVVERMEMENRQREFDINSYTSCYTLYSIMDTMMSIDLNNSTKTSALVDVITSVTDTTITRIVKPWLQSDLIFNFFSHGQTFQKNLEYINDYLRNLGHSTSSEKLDFGDVGDFAENSACCSSDEIRRAAPHRFSKFVFLWEIRETIFSIPEKTVFNRQSSKVLDNAKNEIAEKLGSHPKASLLGLLLTSAQADYKFTDKEIFDELLTVLGAGVETSASLLNIAIFFLAKYPNIQDKVYAEVRDIYRESNSESSNITLQDIDRLDYLNRFIKETLRLFPSIPIICRYLSEEVNIGECTLPAASNVVINFTQCHRSEKNWPEPLEFNPDRFLPNHPLGPRHPYAYMPFSAGARNCIGNKYALLSVKMLLAVLTSRYIIKTKIAQEATNLELKLCISLKTKHPIMISIERRYPELS